MAKVAYEVVATVGTYQKDGEEKKRYQRIGTVFQGDKGLSLKLDCIPVGQEWTGWASLFEPKQEGRDRTAADAYRKPAPSAPAHDTDGDEIPF
jgi:single-strand DNA-binding protein